MRFVLVLLTLVATAVVVTIAMFQTLYYVMGYSTSSRERLDYLG